MQEKKTPPRREERTRRCQDTEDIRKPMIVPSNHEIAGCYNRMPQNPNITCSWMMSKTSELT